MDRNHCSMIVVPWDQNIHYAGDHPHRATHPAQVLLWILNVRPSRFARVSAARRSMALLESRAGQAFSRITDLAAWLPFRIVSAWQDGAALTFSETPAASTCSRAIDAGQAVTCCKPRLSETFTPSGIQVTRCY